MKNMLMGGFAQFNPLEVDEQVARVQHAEGQNRLAQLTLGQKQQEIEQGNTLSQLYKTAVGADGSIDRAKLFQGAAQQGLGAQIPGMQKTFVEQDKAVTDLDKGRHDLAVKRINWTKQNLAELIPDENLSYQSIVGRLAAGLQAGALDEKSVQMAMQHLPQTNDPNLLRQHLTKQLAGAMNAEQQYQAMMSKVEFKDTGGQIQGIETNPSMPDYLKPKTTLKKSMTPGEIATDTRQRQSNSIKAQEVQILGGKHAFEAEGKMFDDHKGQSKTFIDVRDAYQRLSSALPNASKSAAATLAGATTFMKLLDPGSVVRESELGMALAATGALDRATNYFNVLQSGKVLTPSQAKDFQNIADQLYQAAEQSQVQLDESYTQRAGRYGLNPQNIVGDYRAKKPGNTAGNTGGGNRPSLDTFFKR